VKISRATSFLLGGFCLAGLVSAAHAVPQRYDLPAETATLADGPQPGHDLASSNCAACHSVDYITTQPRGLPDPRAFWAAEVTKMRKAYGAPISDEDAQEIAAYLAAAYAK
jgi:mono/diheme cytochrome c family protein